MLIGHHRKAAAWMIVLAAVASSSLTPASGQGMNTADTFLDIDAASAFDQDTFTWFIIFKPNDPAAALGQPVLVSEYEDFNGDGQPDSGASTQHVWGTYIENNRIRCFARSSTGAIRTPTPGIAGTSWTLVSGAWTSSNVVRSWANGVLDGSSSSATATPAGHVRTRLGAPLTGGGYGLDGDIGEILIFGRDLADAERQAVEAYLFNKWIFDIQANLTVTADLLVHLKADVGVESASSNGFVWRDQAAAGGANDASQATAWQQPELVPDGSYNGDLPVVRFGRRVDSSAELTAQLLKFNQEQLDLLAGANGLLEVAPVALPYGDNYVATNWHFGHPVATLAGDAIVVVYHRTPQHFGGIRENSYGYRSKAMMVRSTDGGQTWSQPRNLEDDITTPTNDVALGFGPSFATTASGTIVLVSEVGVFRSTDQGATWTHLPGAYSFSVDDLPSGVINNGPNLLEHPLHGLVTLGNRDAGTNPDGTPLPDDEIVMRYSQDMGATWHEAVVDTPPFLKAVEPAAVVLNNEILGLTRSHGGFDPSTKTYRYGQFRFGGTISSPELSFALTNIRATDRRDESGRPAYQGPWSQDTPDLVLNPVTNRLEAVVTNREGLGFGQEDVRLDGTQMTLNLWSIDPAAFQAGQSDWRFEGTLLTRWGTHASGDQDSGSHSDGLHPGAAVLDLAHGVQHIFIYAGNPQGPCGIFRVTRTLDTDQLRQYLGPRPASAAEPVCWLKADTGVESAGGSVATWHDVWTRDGEHDAVQIDPGAQPALVPDAAADGLPAVRFGGQAFLDIDADAEFDGTGLTWFAAIRLENPSSATQQILTSSYRSLDGGATEPDNFASNHLWGTYLESERLRSFGRDSSGAIKTPYPPQTATSAWTILSARWNEDGAVEQWTNDSYDGARTGADASPFGHKGLRIGASAGTPGSLLQGDIGEVIVFNRALDAADRAAYAAYLAGRWNRPLADLNKDGGVDSADGAVLVGCWAGPGASSAPFGCPPMLFEACDLDWDGDVDLRDFSAWQAAASSADEQ